MLSRKDSQEVGLEAAILERVRNSSLVEWLCADNVTGLSLPPKPWLSLIFFGEGVGERSAQRRSVDVNQSGADGSENAGMSSVNADENSAHRKPKDSYGRSFRVGLVGPKPRAKAVGDGQLVSIPAPLAERVKAQGVTQEGR